MKNKNSDLEEEVQGYLRDTGIISDGEKANYVVIEEQELCNLLEEIIPSYQKNARYLKHKEAAEYLGMDERRLYRLVERRQVPFGKRGSALIYDKAKLDDWVELCHKKHGTTMQEAVQRYLKKGNLL